jgi:hypothetical protein
MRARWQQREQDKDMKRFMHLLKTTQENAHMKVIVNSNLSKQREKTEKE